MCKTTEEYFAKLYERLNIKEGPKKSDPDRDEKIILCEKFITYKLQFNYSIEQLVEMLSEHEDTINDILYKNTDDLGIEFLRSRVKKLERRK